MLKNTGDNQKVFLFHLVLVDFVIAMQIAAFSIIPENSFIFSFIISSLVFLLFSGIIKDPAAKDKILLPGLVLMIFGGAINFFFDANYLAFGRTIAGMGAGMVVVGQIGMIFHGKYAQMKKFSLAIVASYIPGLVFGSAVIEFFSGPALPKEKIPYILGAIIPALGIFELNLKSEIFCSRVAITFNNLIVFLKNKKRKMAMIGFGHLAMALINYPFDYILYPYAIWKLGILKGGILMTILSFVSCYIFMLFYDWSKKDWLGIETIKNVKEYNGKSLMGRISSWTLKRGDLAIMVFLSINFDPFITTAYMRKGVEKYEGMNSRDWKIFVLSATIANAYWTLVAFLGVSVIEYIVSIFV
jgi:uncharacterized membrane protein